MIAELRLNEKKNKKKQEIHFSIDKYAKYNISTCDMKLLWMSINKVNSRNVSIGVVYRPPSGQMLCLVG